jgi:raffinose/stachyose/melibiose transport system substrate-binding protein
VKKAALVMMGAVLLSSTAVGCGSSGSSGNSDKQVTLTFFNRYPNQPYKKYFDDVISDFEVQNPNVKINEVTALNADYKQKINVLLGSSNPPDIYFSWGGEYADKFVRGKRALDLTNYIQNNQDWSNQIIHSQFSAYTFGNHVYGVPIYMDAKLFFYNKDIFDKLHLTPPKTWTEFISDLKTIKQNGYVPIALGDQENWAVGHFITTLNQRIVAPDVLKQDYNRTTGQFTDPGYITALQTLQQLIPYLTPQPNAVSDDAAQNSFLNQKAAIYYNETLGIPKILPAKFNWDWFNFPGIEGEKGDPNQLTGAPEGFMVSPTSKHPDVATKFLEFMTSKDEATKMVKETGWDSTVKGAMTSDNTNPKDIEAANTIESASDMTMWLDDAIDSHIVDAYLAGAQELLNGHQTPHQVMKSVQDAATQVRQTAGQ